MLPAVFGSREFAAAGDQPHRAARIVGLYVGRILNGEKPANLPAQQSTKVELIVKHRSCSGRADEVIE